MVWQDEWPTETGMWWFYGWRFGCNKKLLSEEYESPELCLVEVYGTATRGIFTYVTHGHFLYKEEGAVGKWQKTELPQLPKET